MMSMRLRRESIFAVLFVASVGLLGTFFGVG
jgi:hypothetical protein